MTHPTRALLSTPIATALLGCLLAVSVQRCDAGDDSEWGNVQGQFLFDGEIPELPAHKDKAGEPVPNESLIVDPKSKGIANICLYRRKPPQKTHPDLKRSQQETVEFRTQDGRLVPHILAVRTDQTVIWKNFEQEVFCPRLSPFNNDPTSVIFAPDDRKGLPFQLPYPETRTPPIKVSSDTHIWMSAYWIVSDHPYFAITDTNGRFKIDRLPAGEHTFRVWHERAGYVETTEFTRDLTVEIKGGETLTLDPFQIPASMFEGN